MYEVDLDEEKETDDSASLVMIDTMLKLLEQELYILLRDGERQAGIFHTSKMSAIEDGIKADQCYLMTRAKIKSNALSAEWGRHSLVASKEGDKKKPFTVYIKKTKNGYSMTAFKNEPDWAREVIEIVERRYQILRNRSLELTAMRRILKRYSRLLEDHKNDS